MIAAIIQARMSSTRLPNKVLLNLCGQPLLWHIVNRLKFSKKIDRIIIATTKNPRDDVIEQWCRDNCLDLYRGHENDVLSRYYEAATLYKVDTIVRITADDPLKDPEVVDDTITIFQTHNLDFCYNNNPATFPEGLDVEVFSWKALSIANEQASAPYEREHVTQYLFKKPELFKQKNYALKQNFSYLRWTLDEKEDFEMIQKIYGELYRKDRIFLFKDILTLLENNPEIEKINSFVKRSAMYI
ncbi:MAG: glycosyltransferase family protein [Oligoflexia bacterium]|nr:glycosyltransferase family protein [Oligoflexia bacterium]